MKSNKVFALIVVTFILLNIVFETVYANTQYVTINGYRNYDYAREVFELTNQERLDKNIKKLKYDAELTEIAMKRAEEIALYWAHTRPNNTFCSTISPLSNGENLGIAQTSPDAVINAWMNSTGHRRNILTTSYNSIGIGCFRVANVYFWVQIFSVRKTAEEPTQTGKTEKFDTQVEIETDIFSNIVLTYSNSDLVVKAGDILELLKVQIENAGFTNSNVSPSLKYTKIANDDITYSSSNKDIALVDRNGNIYAKAEGTVTITATLGSIVSSYTVTVQPNDTGKVVDFDEEEINGSREEDEFIKSANNEDQVNDENENNENLENTQNETNEETYLKGDIDKNGVIDANDASVVLEIFKAEKATQEDIAIADMDDNGILDSNDAALILEYYKNNG